jgi:uncharacterized protein YecE (DUF72 family)
MGSIHLGASGWTYDHWKERFYPSDVPKKRWFEYYCEHFQTVELNASFYRIPRETAVRSWLNRSPAHFLFAIKMSRLITHSRKLRDCDRELAWFFDRFAPLEPKIGVYLIQVPPSLHLDHDLLSHFIKKLPSRIKAVFEFRHPSWYVEDVYRVIEDAGHGLCIHDMEGSASERRVLGDVAYIRWHGYQQQYGGDYPDDILQDWAKWIVEQESMGVTVFGYFNNDFEGFAIKNCQRLLALTGE